MSLWHFSVTDSSAPSFFYGGVHVYKLCLILLIIAYLLSLEAQIPNITIVCDPFQPAWCFPLKGK